MVDKGILSRRRELCPSKVGWIRNNNVPIRRLGGRNWRLGLSGMMIVVRRPLGVVDTSAPPLSARSALCPSLVVARRREDSGIKMASLFGKRGDDERPVFFTGWSCAVFLYPRRPVSRLKNWIRLLALSQGSTRLWRTSHSMYSVSFTSFLRKIDSSILKKISIGKLGFLRFLQFCFHGKRFHRLELEKIVRNFIFWRDGERRSGIVSRSFIEFTYKRESYKLEVGIFHEEELRLL